MLDSGHNFKDFTVNSLYLSDMDTSGKILFESDDNMNTLWYNRYNHLACSWSKIYFIEKKMNVL